jgi:ABC-type sulfate/molybdate transport systems ATPase subunit
VLITHEADIAAFAKRVIRLRDGQIVEDYRASAVTDLPPRLGVRAHDPHRREHGS